MSYTAILCTSTQNGTSVSPLISPFVFLSHIILEFFLLTFKCTFSFLSSLLSLYSPSHALHSTTTNLVKPRLSCTVLQDPFSLATPCHWNALPPYIRLVLSLTTFKYVLKCLLPQPSSKGSLSLSLFPCFGKIVLSHLFGNVHIRARIYRTFP